MKDLWDDLKPVRKLFYWILDGYIMKCDIVDFPIETAEYKEIMLIIAEEIDRDPRIDPRLKKLAYIGLSKISRDNAYKPLCDRILKRIKTIK